MYKVLLHRQKDLDYHSTVNAIQETVRAINEQDAQGIVDRLDKEPVSIITIEHKEYAEFLEEQLRSLRQSVSIEPDV